MNIKLHTPKSLKMGSGLSTLKQFLLSIVATSVSIALTFGTAAIIENNKKQKEKREIVMMVMYDMYKSLNSVARTDSMIRESMNLQLQIAQDTSKFEKMKYDLVRLVPRVEYTETTERIFSSTIETINTVGNVLFTENVAEFHQNRRLYKTDICDSINKRILIDSPLSSLKSLLNFGYGFDAIMSRALLQAMRQQFTQCKQMMDITDEDLDAYLRERKQMDKSKTDNNDAIHSIEQEVIKHHQIIEEAKKRIE